MSLRDAFTDLVLGGVCAGCERPGRAACPDCRTELTGTPYPTWPDPVPPGLAPPTAVAAYDGAVRALLVAHKEHGRYQLTTVRPVDYTIPDDGPVGRMLRATGRHPWRPAHVHLVASAPGYKSVTTHAFDAASKYLDSDAVFGVRRSLVVDMDGGEATFDIVLDRA